MSTFFAMGGHDAFIWSCYALTAGVMGYLLVQSIQSMKKNEKMIAELEHARASRRAAAQEKPDA